MMQQESHSVRGGGVTIIGDASPEQYGFHLQDLSNFKHLDFAQHPRHSKQTVM